jgi:hypothetical protein
MRARQLSVLISATALCCAAAGGALAADGKAKPMDFSIRSEPAGPATGGQTLKWDARRGRWGLTLNLDQPDSRPSTLNDVQAGAYFRITPSLRIGGSVALGEEQLQANPANKLTPAEGQPRVRLETKFKF